MARRTKEEALVTRNRLLDAAERLFQAQGVSRTSLHQIAVEAGATRGAIYWHFKDKADLFNAMMERVTLPFETAACADLLTNPEPLRQLESSVVSALARIAGDTQIHRVFDIASHMVEYTGETASLRERHLAAREECVADFEQVLTQSARSTGLSLPLPARQAAGGLHAMLSGLMRDWLLQPQAFDLVSAGRHLLQVYLRGLGFGDNGGLPASCAPRALRQRRPLTRRISTDRIRPSEG